MHLFTYGTLRPGHEDAAQVTGRSLGEVATASKYAISRLGDYTALSRGKDYVVGHLYDVPEATLRKLDRLERLYERTTVELADGRKAHAYMLKQSAYEPNPAWIDRLLSTYHDELAARVGASYMPPDEHRGRKVIYPEFGCGYYGCVLPTRYPGIVFKLTTDAAEAAFVTSAIGIGQWPNGIVRYLDVVELPETYRRRRVFALWRQEARHVGLLQTMMGGQAPEAPEYERRYGRRDMAEMKKLLMEFRQSAQELRKIVGRATRPDAILRDAAKLDEWAWSAYIHDRYPSSPRGAHGVAWHKLRLGQLAEMLEHTHPSATVGEALGFYLERGIVLADVHLGNLGEVEFEDYDEWQFGITDPGQMVPLDPKWLEVTVPSIGKAA